MSLPIFEQDGEPAEEGSYHLGVVSDPSLCGGLEVSIQYLRYYMKYYLRYYLGYYLRYYMRYHMRYYMRHYLRYYISKVLERER